MLVIMKSIYDRRRNTIHCTKLIKLADDYYKKALNGIKLIPIRSRFSILYALRLYQAIGHKILRETKSVSKKINTTLSEKMIIFKSFFEFIIMSLRQSNRKQHNKTFINHYKDSRTSMKH